MKQTLALKLGQQLTMTPQLQQAIRLLQLSALDLQQEIQSTLESNPLLEVADDQEEQIIDGGDPDDLTSTDEAHDHDSHDEHNTSEDEYDFSLTTDAAHEESREFEQDTQDQAASQALEGLERQDGLEGDSHVSDQDVSEQIEQPMTEELAVDSSWDDIYPVGPGTAAGPDSDFDPLANQSSDQTLADHLIWQLNLSTIAPSDRVIAEAIIDAINADGMLTLSIEDLCDSLQDESTDAAEQVTPEDVIAILERVQDFDPLGVGARSLQECLLIQLSQMPAKTPWLLEACSIVELHMDLLATKDFTTLKRKTKLDSDSLGEIMNLIRTLNPRPGSAISEEAAEYIVPDVIVRKSEGRWLVELNGEATPQIRINTLYEGMLKEGAKGTDRAYIRDNLQEARWFLKSLQTRHDTLLRVASKIVEVQRGFLEYGPQAMKPLILAEIAEAVELHESTISRVTTRKYMTTPQGVFELKYFFSSHVGTSTGGEVSSTAIRALIQKLTAEEDPRKPLSDNKIAAILKDQKINVARRTVAKYRESMSIPPSNERKQLV